MDGSERTARELEFIDALGAPRASPYDRFSTLPETTWVIGPGGGEGAGTPDDPWSFTYAAGGAGGRIRPGHTVRLLSGSYRSEEGFRISFSGAAALPVRWVAEPGVELDGAIPEFVDSPENAWVPYKVTEKLHLYHSTSVFPRASVYGGFIEIDGEWLPLAPHPASEDTNRLAWIGSHDHSLPPEPGPAYYLGPGLCFVPIDTNNGHVYVRLDNSSQEAQCGRNVAHINDTDPRHHQLRISRGNQFGLTVAGNHHIFQGFTQINNYYGGFRLGAAVSRVTFRRVGGRVTYFGARLGDASDVVIEDASFDGCMDPERWWVSYADIKGKGEPAKNVRKCGVDYGNSQYVEVRGGYFHDFFDSGLSEGAHDIEVHGVEFRTWDDAWQMFGSLYRVDLHHNTYLGAGPSRDMTATNEANPDPGTLWIHDNIIDTTRYRLFHRFRRKAAATGICWREPVSFSSHVQRGGVYAVSFHPDKTKKEFVSGGIGDRTVRLWNWNVGSVIGEPLTGHSGTVLSVAFHPHGMLLASGGEGVAENLWLWDLSRSSERRGQALKGHTGAVHSVAFSPDGKYLASASADGTLQLWDLDKREPVGQALTPGHNGPVYAVAFSPDGARLVSAGSDKTVRRWDVAQRAPVGDPLTGHPGQVFSVAFSSDNKWLASAGEGNETHEKKKNLWLWNLENAQPVGQPLEGHPRRVRSVAFSPDGKRLASAGEGIHESYFCPPVDQKNLWLWDLTTDSPIGESLKDHMNDVVSVAFSPDGARLVSASEDSTLRLWSIAKRTPLLKPLTYRRTIPWKLYQNTIVTGTPDIEATSPYIDVGQFGRRAAIIESPNEAYNNIFVVGRHNYSLGRETWVHTGGEIYDGNVYWGWPEPTPDRNVAIWRCLHHFRGSVDGHASDDPISTVEKLRRLAYEDSQKYWPPGWESAGLMVDPQLGSDYRPQNQAIASGAVDLTATGWPGTSVYKPWRGAVPLPMHHVVNRSAEHGTPRASGAPTAFLRPALGDHVIAYREKSGHLRELWRDAKGATGTTDLTDSADAPSARGNPFAYVDALRNLAILLFRDGVGTVRSLYWTTGDVDDDDLSGTARAPRAYGNPVGYYVAGADAHHVVYRSRDGHLHELNWVGVSPVTYGGNLTKAISAPTAAGDPSAFVDAGGVNTVVYRGANRHILSVYWKDGPSGRDDLSGFAATPPAVEDPLAFYTPNDDTHHVFYVGNDSHLWELWWVGIEPVAGRDLSAISGAPAPAAKPAAYYSAGTDSKHVIYRSTDGRLHQIWWSAQGGTPAHVDITARYGAPLAADRPAAFTVERPNTHHVAYRGTDDQIYEVLWYGRRRERCL